MNSEFVLKSSEEYDAEAPLFQIKPDWLQGIGCHGKLDNVYLDNPTSEVEELFKSMQAEKADDQCDLLNSDESTCGSSKPEFDLGEGLVGKEVEAAQVKPDEETLDRSMQVSEDAVSVFTSSSEKLPPCKALDMISGPENLYNLEECVTFLLVKNQIILPEHSSERNWKRILDLFFPKGWRNLETLTVLDDSRRDDQVVKRTMTFIKDLIYKPLKEERFVDQGVWRKRTKNEAFALLQEKFKTNTRMTDCWFGSKLKDGLKNEMIDYLFTPEGSKLFSEITSIEFVQRLVKDLNTQTDLDIQTNLLSKLRNREMAETFLRSKEQSTKLPSSYKCNPISCLYFYHRIYTRKVGYNQNGEEGEDSLERLSRVLNHLMAQISCASIADQQPDQTQPQELGKKVKIYFRIKTQF